MKNLERVVGSPACRLHLETLGDHGETNECLKKTIGHVVWADKSPPPPPVFGKEDKKQARNHLWQHSPDVLAPFCMGGCTHRGVDPAGCYWLIPPGCDWLTSLIVNG